MQRRVPTSMFGRTRASQNSGRENAEGIAQTSSPSHHTPGHRPTTTRGQTLRTPTDFGNRGRSPSTSPRRPTRRTPGRNTTRPISRHLTTTIPTVATIQRSISRHPRGISRRGIRPTSRASSSGGSQVSRASSRSPVPRGARRRQIAQLTNNSTRSRRGSRTRASHSGSSSQSTERAETETTSSTFPLLPHHGSQDPTTLSSHRTGRVRILGRSPSRRRSRSKSRVSFTLSNSTPSKSSMKSVVESEKCLQRIFGYFNWNELLVVRQVSKKWLEVVSSDPKLKEASGIIAVRKDFSALKTYNDSLVIWTKFCLYAPVPVDLTEKIQAEFWGKHCESIIHLELRSSGLTTPGLVQILSRCHNLVHFVVVWTSEMYSFNLDLIRKYYGVNIRNGALSKIFSMTIEKSSFLTDNALSALLKWCGSSLQSLTLTCSPDDIDESLCRLKPRWTLEPIETFTTRFSYARNLKFLDFSGSNLNSADLIRLGEVEKLILTGIRLSNCKINDESTLRFLLLKGPRLEQIYLDYTLITDNIFDVKENPDLNLKKLTVLDISGTQNFRNLNFLPSLNLDDLRCGDTGWLNHTMLPKPVEAHNLTKKLSKVNFSKGEKYVSKNFDERQRGAWFLHFCVLLRNLTEINLNFWTTFGTDDNFRLLCFNIPNLKKLRIRGWSNLTDEGVIGFSFADLIDMEDAEKDIWANTRTRLQKQSLGRLRGLNLVDFGCCLKLTDTSIQFGILYLPNLRMLSLDGSHVTDVGIHVLIAKSKTLDKLSILGCDHITPKGRKINRLDGRSVQFGSLPTD